VTVAGTPGSQPHRHASYRHGPNRCFQLAVRPPSRRCVPAADRGHRQGTLQAGIHRQHPRWPLLARLGWDGEPVIQSEQIRSPPRRHCPVARQRPRLPLLHERGGTRADAPGAEGPQRTATPQQCHRDLSAAQQAAFAAEGREAVIRFRIDDQATIGWSDLVRVRCAGAATTSAVTW